MSKVKTAGTSIIRFYQCVVTLCVVFLAPASQARPDYRFVNYWPVLQQPWYFSSFFRAEVSQDLIYVYESDVPQVRVFSKDGRFLSSVDLCSDSRAPQALDFRNDGSAVAACGSFFGRVIRLFSPELELEREFLIEGIVDDIVYYDEEIFLAFRQGQGLMPPFSRDKPLAVYSDDGRLLAEMGEAELGSEIGFASIDYHPSFGLLALDSIQGVLPPQGVLHQYSRNGQFERSIEVSQAGNPRSINVSGNGKTYIPSVGNEAPGRVLVLGENLEFENTFAFQPYERYYGGTSFAASFEDGNLMLAGRFGIALSSPTGTLSALFDSRSALPAGLELPVRVAANSSFVFVSDFTAIKVFDHLGKFQFAFGEDQADPGGLSDGGLSDIDISASGDTYAVHRTGRQDRVLIFGPNGSLTRVFGGVLPRNFGRI